VKIDQTENWIELVDCPDIAQEAFTIVRNEEAVAFIGSGISAKCYPSWGEIIKKLCENCGVSYSENINSENFIEKAEECKQKHEDKYHETLADLLGKQTTIFRFTCDLLLRLPFKSYITVNLDPMLAIRAQYLNKKSEIFVYPFLKNEGIRNGNIFYIHGSLGEFSHNPKKIVFSKSEFEEAYVDKGILESFLIQLFAFNNVIFFGCRLSEPPLYKLLEVIKKNIEQISHAFPGTSLPKRFIFLAKDEGDKELDSYYKRIGINLIRYNKINEDHRGLDKILENWCDLKPIRPEIGFTSFGG